MYLKKDFLSDWKNILETPLGFSIIENDISLISIGEEYNKYIYISDRRYFPHGAYIDGISVGISYHNVEQILEDAYRKLGVKKMQGGIRTVKKVLIQLEDIDYSVFNTEISNQKTFNLVNEQIQKIIKQYALPFFEQYNTLEKVAVLLADKTPQEVVPYVQGSILFPKTILILKLSNHPSFNTKLLEYYEVLKKQAEKKDTYKDVLTVFLELFQEDLDNIDPPLVTTRIKR